VSAGAVTVRALSRVGAVPRAEWDAVVDPDAPPFASHGFLTALEDGGVVGVERGWEPIALVAERPGADGRAELVGAAVTWLKRDAWGEFVDDRVHVAEARAAGDAYYPKLVLATPFTPVPGPRLHADPALPGPIRAEIRLALLDAALDTARERGCHGVHLLHAAPSDLAAAAARGFATRLGMTFRWERAGEADLEGLLARLPTKRRTAIRRERRRLREAGLMTTQLSGDGVPDALDGAMYAFYRMTADRYVDRAGARPAPLSRRFFALLWERMRPHLRMTAGWYGGRLVAAALDLEKDSRRFGCYWGSAREIDALHFELCAYTPLEDCLARGVDSFSVGPGGRAHKVPRGFLPCDDESAHLLFDDTRHAALASECERESAAIRAEIEVSRDRVFIR